MLGTPRMYLGSEPVRLRNALASLDHVLTRDDGDDLNVTLDQQGDWIIGELEQAIDRIRRAQTAVAAARAIARCEAAEADERRAAA